MTQKDYFVKEEESLSNCRMRIFKSMNRVICHHALSSRPLILQIFDRAQPGLGSTPIRGRSAAMATTHQSSAADSTNPLEAVKEWIDGSRSDSTQSVFERAVRHHLPSAFVPLLERVDEFAVGKVLVLHKKPHFWRHDALDFTSLDFQLLLTEVQGQGKVFGVQTERKKQFDQSVDSSNRMIKIDLGLDAELKTKLGDIGGDIGGGGAKSLQVLVNFGSITHIISDLPHTLMSHQWTIDNSHAVIKDALVKGKEMFVITSVYEAQKVIVKIQETIKVDIDTKNQDGSLKSEDKAGGGDEAVDSEASGGGSSSNSGDSSNGGGGGGGASAGENEKGSDDINSDSKGMTITSRNYPTVIAFNVMKLTIDADSGVVTPHAKTGLHSHPIHDSYGDTYVTVHQDQAKKDSPK